MPECRDLEIDLEESWLLDLGFDIAQVDVGLAEGERGCTPERSTEKAGSRHIHDIIAERFAAGDAARRTLDPAAKRAMATRLAKVKAPSETGYRAKEIFAGEVEGHVVSRVVVQYPKTGAMVPAVCVARKGADKTPVLVAAHDGRVRGLRLADSFLKDGHPVMIADITGIGEIGREKFFFYGAKDRPDEGLGAMCYLMGEPLVGRRATDLRVLAEFFAKRCGGAKPQLLASGPLAIPAAHAFAADPSAWSGIELVERPDPWFKVLKDGAANPVELRYADIVPRAAMSYDWTELVP
jgi:hypothetical protein